MRKITAIIFMFIFSISAFAFDDKKQPKLYEKKSDKERIYRVGFEPLWRAAIEAAKEHFTVDQIHKEEGLFTFNSGAGFTTHGFDVNVSFSKDDEGGTRIKLNFHKKKAQLFSWGAGGNIADKFFKELDKKLEQEMTTK